MQLLLTTSACLAKATAAAKPEVLFPVRTLHVSIERYSLSKGARLSMCTITQFNERIGNI